ncbi:uncharacterized protein ACOB8E_009472 [Sarcophilus harrisii]
MLAWAHGQLLQEHHRSQIQEELSWLGQDKETATHQAPDLSAESRIAQDHAALVLKLESLRVERDAAERDLEALCELHVQGARAQTCHMLQEKSDQKLKKKNRKKKQANKQQRNKQQKK